jgi:hypothetical protein
VAIDSRRDGTEGALEFGVGDIEGEVVDGATEFFEGIEEDLCLAEVSCFVSSGYSTIGS